jgi:hypothetical protein
MILTYSVMMKKKAKNKIIPKGFFLAVLGCVLLSSCFQAYNPDEDLRTVPVTNNPNIVPNHGSGLVPGMGGSRR